MTVLYPVAKAILPSHLTICDLSMTENLGRFFMIRPVIKHDDKILFVYKLILAYIITSQLSDS